jgi:hypothetical protein
MALITTTSVLGLIGGACMIVGWGFQPAAWHFLNTGQGPAPRRAQWQHALLWGGFALVVLSQWRAWSGQ